MIITHGMNNIRLQQKERGIALLITLLIMTVLLGVSASLLNITIKQFQFSSIGLASEMAFQAANAGMECMLFHDFLDRDPSTPGSLESKFDIGQPNTDITCMNVSDGPTVQSSTGYVQRTYRFSWSTGVSGAPSLCTEMSIFKFYSDSSAPDMYNALRRSGNCAIGTTCTVIQSRGYNVACGSIQTPRVIERELTQRY